MIKVMVFDLGNVLFRFDPKRASEAFAKFNKKISSPEAIVHFFQGSYREKDHCEGRISSEAFYQHVVQELGFQGDFQTFQQIYCNIFTDLPQSFAIVKAVKQRNYPLFLLSNTNPLHFDYLYQRDPILKLFDAFILSYEVHCQKPDRKIYEILIQRARCKPEEIFFTDDLKENVDAAAELGFQAHQFINASTLKRELLAHCILTE